MKHRWWAAFVVGAALAGPQARAAVFTDRIGGSGTHFFYFGVPGDCSPGSPGWDDCLAGIEAVHWSGSISVTLGSGADGTYRGDAVQAIAYESAHAGVYGLAGREAFGWRAGDLPVSTVGQLGLYDVGAQSAPVVTIEHGVISQLSFAYQTVDAIFCIGPGTLTEVSNAQIHTGDSWRLSGFASPVPEPSAAALALLGLGALPLLRRRRPAPGGRQNPTETPADAVQRGVSW